MRAACGLLLKLSPWQEASCKFTQAYGGGGVGEDCFVCDSECMCRGDWARSSVDMTHFKPFKGIPRVLPAKDIDKQVAPSHDKTGGVLFLSWLGAKKKKKSQSRNQPSNLDAFHRALLEGAVSCFSARSRLSRPEKPEKCTTEHIYLFSQGTGCSGQIPLKRVVACLGRPAVISVLPPQTNLGNSRGAQAEVSLCALQCFPKVAAAVSAVSLSRPLCIKL